MDSVGNKFAQSVPILVLFLLLYVLSPVVLATEKKVGFGIQAGVNKLEGDWYKPKLNQMGGAVLSVHPNPYFSIRAVSQYSKLKSLSDAKRIDPSFTTPEKLAILTIPLDLELMFNFAPFSNVNPFGIIGGGALYYEVKYGGKLLKLAAEQQRTYTPTIKAGGGLEFNISSSVSFLLGADFRYTWTDKLDQISSGDEKDGLISVWSGFTTYFGGGRRQSDLDGDQIPDELDLAPRNAETINGYLDHDGKPDLSPAKARNLHNPTVLHKPVFRIKAGKDLVLKARILSDEPVRTPAMLYRRKGQKNWKVELLQNEKGDLYRVQLGKKVIQSDFEYCIVAVTKSVSGVGYAGSPKRPIRVHVLPDDKFWKTTGGLLTAAAWGSASFIILRKQRN